jgi:hypothetical protein
MWSHYSDSHRGLVIALDAVHNMLRAEAGPSPAKYVRQRVLLDIAWIHDRARLDKFGRELFLSKNLDWSYEEEVRQVFPLPALETRRLPDGKIGYFLPIQPDGIVSVTLGARCPRDLEESAKTLLRDPKFSHVKLKHARLHESKFGLTFD